jgi:hypothetical protein
LSGRINLVGQEVIMPEVRLQVRQSHAISNAAVGSLIQIGGLSLVQCDIRDWGSDGEEVDMPRLSKMLAVTFRKAPVREKKGDIEMSYSGRPVSKVDVLQELPQDVLLRSKGGGQN